MVEFESLMADWNLHILEVLVHDLIGQKRADIAALCRRYRVHHLDLFGSAVGASFDVDRSDIDVLVEFIDHPEVDRFDCYFGLKEGLEQLFGRAVDVVSISSLRNPYFRARVMQTKEELYAA